MTPPQGRPVEPDQWSWQQRFTGALPSADGFATRHRMTLRVWQP
jgi:hypothetical protein